MVDVGLVMGFGRTHSCFMLGHIDCLIFRHYLSDHGADDVVIRHGMGIYAHYPCGTRHARQKYALCTVLPRTRFSDADAGTLCAAFVRVVVTF